MLYSVVTPVYNRKENLRLCLQALSHQIDPPEFEVIVVDDGSTDGVQEMMYSNYPEARDDYRGIMGGITRELALPLAHSSGFEHATLTYLSGGPNKGFRGGRARNIGAFNAKGERLIFIDSDVIVNDHLLHFYDVAAKEQPKAIIVGRYFYMPRIELSDHPEILWESQDYDEVKAKADLYQLKIDTPDGALKYGIDLGGRPPEAFFDDTSRTVKGAALGGLSGNISYPLDLFTRVGGFEEKMIGHGGEDACLGLTVDDAEQPDWLFYAPLRAFHIWHTRDQRRNQREVDANIEYMDRRFGIGRYAKAKKWSDSMDKSNPGHYHIHQGAVAIKTANDQTVWLARPDHMTRIGVTTHTWLIRMGFIPLDVRVVSAEEMAKYEDKGVTREVDGFGLQTSDNVQ